MNHITQTPAAIAQPTSQKIVLSGYWTALGIGKLDQQLGALTAPPSASIVIDGSAVEGLDTVGVWLLENLLQRLRAEGHPVQLQGWRPQFSKLIELISQHPKTPLPEMPPARMLDRIGQAAIATGEQALALLGFLGESAVALGGNIVHPARVRWRLILHNIASAGFDALPIVGLLSFLMGIVIAYQTSDQLRQFGANIFVADLVGLSMLREFAPLMTAIIVAGRSGSAYAAQIGTMSVSDEIDAMRTIGIMPIDLLVLPKIVGLMIALPLLTVFADVLGVFGGMIMARAQLGIGFEDFLERFSKAVSVTAYMTGIGKAPVFAGIIAVVGCFQGLRTRGGADSVGRQTTRAVVQAIFLVVVADAVFSVVFSILDL